MYIQLKELNNSFPTSIDTPMFLPHYIWLRRTSLKVGPEVIIQNWKVFPKNHDFRFFKQLKFVPPGLVYVWEGGVSVRVH